jgi:multidrug efflux pump subunit AcrA (membrane-fusion protein)
MSNNPDPAGFIQQQNQQQEDTRDDLLAEILAATSLQPRKDHPTLAGDLLEILTTTEKKERRKAILAKARQALDTARAVRRAEKEAAQATLAAEKAQAKAEAAEAKAQAKAQAKAADKHAKHYSLVRCMRRGAKLLRFTTGWGGTKLRKGKTVPASRETRVTGCALMAAVVGHYGSVEKWREAGSPYGPAKCRELWPALTNAEMTRIMSENDTEVTTREQQAAKLKAKGF